MIPVGWNPRSHPPIRYAFNGEKIIWYLKSGNYHIPHDKEVVLSWDHEYINKESDSIYTARERRKAYCQYYGIMARIFSKVNPEILKGE